MSQSCTHPPSLSLPFLHIPYNSSRGDVKEMLDSMRARRAQRATATQRGGGGEAKMEPTSLTSSYQER